MEKEMKKCLKCEREFGIDANDNEFYGRFRVPSQTRCPECRMIRRLLFRNERTWYRRKCDATGEQMLAMFAPDVPLKVYKNDYWKSDAWDPLDYGRDYDFSKPFFEQFSDLFRAVPHPNLIQKNVIGSEYSNNALNLKNCYFVASIDTAEDCMYCFGAVLRARECLDAHLVSNVELCYETIDSENSSKLRFCETSINCADSWLLYNCVNCSDCVGCVGLRNKSNCIFNEQYSKEEYKKRAQELNLGTHKGLEQAKKRFEELKRKTPRKFSAIVKSENVTGDEIANSRNLRHCFYAKNDIENCRYGLRFMVGVKDSMDCFIAWNKSERVYEGMSVSGQDVKCSAYIWGGFDVEYSHNCFDSNHIFGCVGLRNKEYCILNKQYSKEEYESLVPKIIEEMKKRGEYGEFFSENMSPFAYNESMAQDYYPLNETEAKSKDFSWRQMGKKEYKITIPQGAIPENIEEVSENIIKEILECAHKGECKEQCATAFKIMPQELVFYKRLGVPIPRLCPQCRHMERVRMKNPLQLWNRACMKTGCGNKFETPYSPDRPEIIYCESCYQKEAA